MKIKRKELRKFIKKNTEQHQLKEQYKNNRASKLRTPKMIWFLLKNKCIGYDLFTK